MQQHSNCKRQCFLCGPCLSYYISSPRANADLENIKGFILAVVKLMSVHVTKLPL
jgi:hypothetical protein